ncbi:T9SS type A sorting domain-containing protein [Yeosuana sp. MJ-SS3]|uniref:T9SS type A sorting domain-containing protein n=1 Tax=Gilvirhabdus luticola TaxID=3079858 RepID=A0ABU3U6S8_9FLAO|nr:T9SS type A sorting domain-containing protein [Yeosuana sp. MJ-SS3]MDU8886114.1 T9SS type A sorting domain-containing protein [Yeosuana sp. MJ-SS3]
MKKNYYFCVLLVFLFTNFIYAQATCPESFGNQGSQTVIHFKIQAGTCNDYSQTILVTLDSYNQVFTKTSCNGTNLKYTSTGSNLPNSTLTFNVRFVSNGLDCQYVNGVLATLSDRDAELNQQINIYPNPVSSSDFTVKIGKNITGSLNLYNLSGKLVSRNTINNLNSKDINVSNLTNGVYMLNIVTDEASVTRKVIIMK